MKKLIVPVIILSAIMLALSACKQGNSSEGIIILTTDNFADETAKGVVLVDFWATWCIPCRALAPVIEEIAEQAKGKIKVGKVDIDSDGPLANQFGIQSIPTVIIFKDGQKMETFVGIQSKEALVNALSKYADLE